MSQPSRSTKKGNRMWGWRRDGAGGGAVRGHRLISFTYSLIELDAICRIRNKWCTYCRLIQPPAPGKNSIICISWDKNNFFFFYLHAHIFSHWIKKVQKNQVFSKTGKGWHPQWVYLDTEWQRWFQYSWFNYKSCQLVLLFWRWFCGFFWPGPHKIMSSMILWGTIKLHWINRSNVMSSVIL